MQLIQMNLLAKCLIFFFLLFISSNSYTQNCNCTVSQVESNTVNPCNYSIGTVVTVTTESEFMAAVNQANSSGGNMTILIADGTYQVASVSSYPYVTASNVVFRSLSGNRDDVILTGSGMADAGGTEIVIYAVGDNITIANLTIKNVGNHGIAVTGDNLYVYNVKIQDTYEQMIKGNSSGGGISNGVVKCSLFEYTNGIGPQWYIGGLDIHTGTNWTVSDNVFHDISSPSVSVAEHAVHFWDSSADNLVERNKIVNCDRGIGFGLGNSPNNGGVIKNNMITNDGTNIYDDVGIGLESSPNTKVYNNSVFIAYDNAIEYRFSATTNVDITNNVTNKLIKERDGGSATLTTNNINGVPAWFVNTSSGDLHLSGNIPELVDMGTNLPNVTLDFDQAARPQGIIHDIGAVEFPQTFGLFDLESETSTLTVYPSPAQRSFTLKSAENTSGSIVIYNALNQKVASFDSENLAEPFLVDVSTWPNGTYFCQVLDTEQKFQIARIVIAR